MRFFADLFYLLLKILVLGIYRIFYSKVTIINEQYLNLQNPSIVVSNHPSTLMDPLSTASRIPRRVAFLANAGLFKNPAFGAFLKIYCIPIERPKDVNGRRINNADSFARADEHLANNGCIYIAPEGTSAVERRLRKVKTGTARIALSAESKQEFNLGVTILPVGLTYSSPLEFRSELIVNVGVPLEVKAYKEQHKENPFHASKKLTAELQQQMQSLIFHTEEEAPDVLLSHIQTVLQSDQPLAPKERFLRSKKVLANLLSLEAPAFESLKKDADDYFNLIQKSGLKDLSIARIKRNHSSFPIFLKLLFGLPLFLYGWINNFLAFFIPGFIAKKLNIFHGYIPTIKVMTGMFFLPLFFYIQTKFVSHYLDIPYIGWIYLLTLLPMGWIAWQYRKVAIRFFQDQKVQRFKKNSAVNFDQLISKRNHLLSLIDSLV